MPGRHTIMQFVSVFVADRRYMFGAVCVTTAVGVVAVMAVGPWPVPWPWPDRTNINPPPLSAGIPVPPDLALSFPKLRRLVRAAGWRLAPRLWQRVHHARSQVSVELR